MSIDCGGQPVLQGPVGFYQFVVDDAAPTIGPTDKDGNYMFEKNVFTTCESVRVQGSSELSGFCSSQRDQCGFQ